MSDFVVPDVHGEIVGWRAWQVIGSVTLPILASVTHKGTVWHPGRWTHATCNGNEFCMKDRSFAIPGHYTSLAEWEADLRNRIPGERCSCGLYAARDRRQLIKLGYFREHVKPVFIGQVGFVGKVIPGSQGWRAEKGRIRKLYVPVHHYAYVDGLRETYGVEVVLDKTDRVQPLFGD